MNTEEAIRIGESYGLKDADEVCECPECNRPVFFSQLKDGSAAVDSSGEYAFHKRCSEEA